MKKVLLLAPMASVHERFNIANLRVLDRLGCEIHIAANFEIDEHAKEYAKELGDAGIITHHIPFERASLKKNLRYISELKSLFKREKYDMVHCHTETGGILTRLAMSANKNTKYVYTPHGMSFYKGSSWKSQLIYRPIERWICGGMSANLAMNNEEYEVLSKWDSDTARFIHGVGVELENIQQAKVDIEGKREELGIPKDALLLLSVGELNDNKNHTIVLQALNQMEKRPDNLYYLICGEGPSRQALEEQAKAMGFGQRFKLPGYRYDIAEIFNIADIFVFPSHHEGLPVSMMQAMAAGLPVLCSNIRGNCDLVHFGEGGFLCAPNDACGFAQAIQMLLDTRDLAVQMGQHNLKRVEAYSIENVEEETIKIYQDILR